MAKKVTMQDIADVLQISKNSVSQALTGKPGVSEKTREKVIETAKKLGYMYTPSTGKSGSSRGIIGLIASEYVFTENNFFGAIHLSIDKEVKSRHCGLLIHSVDRNSEEQEIIPPFVQERQVDGLLILSHLKTKYIKKIMSKKLPTVLIDHHHPLLEVDCILSNNRFGAYNAVKHLIELGHKKIGFIGNVASSPSYQERWEGYRLALNDAGLPVPHEQQWLKSKETEEGISTFLDSLASYPTAWFCGNDTLAFLLNTCMQKRGIKVPEEMSICGFDNLQLSEMASPALTTVNINKDYFGKRAVDRLFWRMEHMDAPYEEILLPTRLIPRGSTTKIQNHKK